MPLAGFGARLQRQQTATPPQQLGQETLLLLFAAAMRECQELDWLQPLEQNLTRQQASKGLRERPLR